MFGTGASGGTGGGFGGFGTNNNNNNNNNQAGNTGGSVFGTGTGFGQPASTGFGNTGGGFGQQQNTSNAFGGAATTANTGFGGTSGGFGATNNAAASPFGAAKPFGGTTQPASSGLFGGNNASNTTSGGSGFGFGAASNASNVFGGGGNTAATSGGGLFGGSKPTFGPTTTTAGATGGLFGTANSGTGGAFGGAANTGIGFSSGTGQGPLTGTANPPYSAFTEKEAQGGTTNHFQTIAFMPAYKNWSLEELRLQDYVQGRRYGTDSGNSGAFGQPTQFGATFGATNTNTSGFGATNTSATTGGGLFGNTANNNTTSAPFGATNTGGGFGTGGAQTGGGGGLFGANKPATGGLFGATNNTATTGGGGGGLFGTGANNTATGAFGGGNTTGTFGAAGTTGATGGLFGGANNNQQAQKPFSFGNTGTGFGGGASNTAFNAQGNNAPATGGGLFGNAQSTTPAFGAAQAGTGFGGAGGAFGAAGQNQGGTAFGTFGNNNQAQPNKPPFGAPFGAAQATTTAGGGGLFGNNNQQQQQQNAGGLFGGGDNKPFGPPTISTGAQGGGLFGGGATATGGTAGGLFGGGQAAQPSQGGLFGSGAGANAGGGGLFGNNANKPPGMQGGGLFSNTGPPAPTGGNLFGGSALGSQLNTSTGGGFFNNQQQQQPQQQQQMAGNSLFGSQFGNSLQGQQQQQGLTASIMDSPYVNPVLGSSLGNVPNSLMGPIATPLSSSVQTKKAAMIPHYKIAPRQPSLAPRLGNSFSRSGSPFAASSGSHATLGNSGSLGRSFSSTNKLHLFDGDDSILNSSSFTPNTSSRVASLKRLVIDKKIRDQDLFSGGQDLRKDNSGSSDFAAKGGTKGILKKTVSFDIAANRRGEDELFGVGTTSAKGKETVGPAPTAEEMGFLRSTPERRRLREVEETSNGSTSASDAPVVGNEVAIIPEKPKDDKSPGTYWMVPNASKLKILPKEQQKRVMNLTIGRRGYGQVRFDNPVDISDIEDIDKIPGHIVLFAQRVCTVYPETMPKPPPGKGLNVPATITLEDCFPVSKNERGKIRDPEHPRYITHIRRLKSIKDTEFVNYLANEGMWIFRVRHFTTYGLVESDDEEEGGDYTVDESTMLPTGETPTPTRTPGSSLWDGDEESSMDADVSGVDNTSSYDDTFDFKKFGSSAITSRSNRDRYGSFLDRSDRETTYEESEEEEEDVTMDQSFLGEGSVGSAEDVDEPAEPESDQSEEEEVDTTIIMDDETDGDVTGALVLADSYMLSPVKEGEEEDTITQDTPAKPLPMGQDWTEQLNNTISPKKRRFGGESFMASTRKLANSPVKKFNIEPMSYGLLDLANDLYGGGASGINGNSTKGKGKAVWDQVESPTSSRCRHESAWTATKDDKGNVDTESDDKRWRNAIKPVWGKDGSIIYFGDLEGLERRRNYRTDLKLAKLKYSIQDSESQGAPEPLRLQLRATAIKRDEFNVPVAELQMDTLFHSFTQLSWSPDDPASQHEKSVWELASVLWDPITRELALEEESQEMIEYMQETCRKERLSKFLEALVEVAADEHVHGATTLEEAAIAHLTAHRIEQACASLLEAGDFRLANLITMVGGDAKLRSSIKKQLEQWKNKGVLAEIPVPIRALYELLAGNTCYSEGVRGPPEDAAPSFFIPDRFSLDWKRGFGLKLWYGCPEEEPIGNAVVDYEADMREYPEAVPAPKPWYHTEANPAHDGAIDILWGLLKLYADRELNLEEVLAPMNMTTSYIDYRLSWQLRTILAKKGIRDFSGGKLHRRIDGTDEFIAGSMADQITIDFAGELETLGMWEWAIFVLLHLTDTDSRETAVRNVIGKHIDELESAEGADVGKKLEFLEKTLLIPKNWIYEARALQARSAGRHLLEAEYLLAAQAWNEAHKTVVKKVAPEAVISGDLEILKLTLAKFEDVDLVDKWNLGGQIYLDYIHLQEYVLSGKLHLGPAKNAPGQKGLPKSNSPKDLARRLLIGLKNADRKGFLQNVAVREMAGVVGSWVLKSEDMVSEAPKLLELPLTEDQFLRKTVNLGLAYYKARLQEVR